MAESWRVKIEGGSIIVDASSASEARREAIQAFAEDLSLFSVAPEQDVSELVARLRDVDEPNALIVRRNAADEIERLQATVPRLDSTHTTGPSAP